MHVHLTDRKIELQSRAVLWVQSIRAWTLSLTLGLWGAAVQSSHLSLLPHICQGSKELNRQGT